MAAFSLEELSYVFLWVLSVLKDFHQLSVVPIQQTNGFNAAFERLKRMVLMCPLWGLLKSELALNSYMQA